MWVVWRDDGLWMARRDGDIVCGETYDELMEQIDAEDKAGDVVEDGE